MTSNKGFRDLRVWHRAIELVQDVYQATNRLPASELYGLATQMRRSAVSIPSNVAEGCRRGHAKEFTQFLRIALGSCAELETQVVIAKKLDYLDEGSERSLLEGIDHVNRMIANLLKNI